MSAKPYRFAVLACSASKLHQPAKAKDLYVAFVAKLGSWSIHNMNRVEREAPTQIRRRAA